MRRTVYIDHSRFDDPGLRIIVDPPKYLALRVIHPAGIARISPGDSGRRCTQPSSGDGMRPITSSREQAGLRFVVSLRMEYGRGEGPNRIVWEGAST